jgi:class 3 adenylate cyclase
MSTPGKPSRSARKAAGRSRVKGVRAGGLVRGRNAAEARLAPQTAEVDTRRLPIAVVVAEVRGLGLGRGESQRAESARLLRDVCTALTDVGVERGASIDGMEGGGFRFLYGMTDCRRDDAAQALLTALAVQRAFLALRNQWMRRADAAASLLALGVGVASGRAILRRGRSGERAATLSGRPLKRAAQLGEAARPLEVLVDAQTLSSIGRSLDDQVQFTPRRVRPRSARPSIAYRAQVKRAYLRLVRNADSPRSAQPPASFSR